jgi:ankyrin repeat protein
MFTKNPRFLYGICLLLFFVALDGIAAPPDRTLVEAAQSRSANTVQELLEQGANVNTLGPDGTTALHWAVYWDDEEMVDLLLEAGAEVNARNELGATPLWLASVEGRASMVEVLLAAEADPNLSLLMGETSLMAASRAGSTDAVTALLDNSADVNARERTRGQTALTWAVSEKHAGVVRLLVKHGAKVNARSAVRRMFWNTGSDGGRDPESMVWLDDGGFTPLLHAARVGDIASAEILLAAGADVDEQTPQGATPLAIAVFSGHTAVGELLLSKGADPNAAGAGYAPLHAAILRGDATMVRALLAHRADPNARLQAGTGYGRGANDWFLSWLWIDATPIWLAARLSEVNIMGILAEVGAETHVVKKGGTNLVMAPIALIRERGSRAGKRSPEEEKRDRPEAKLDAVRTALGFSIDVNMTDDDGNTALHMAATHGLNPVVQLLVERGAAINVKNNEDKTPLMLALASERQRDSDDEAASDELSTADLLRQLGAMEPPAEEPVEPGV